MKTPIKWRVLLRFLLFSVGFLAFARAYGEPIKPMSDAEWFAQFIISHFIGTIFIVAFYKLSEKD